MQKVDARTLWYSVIPFYSSFNDLTSLETNSDSVVSIEYWKEKKKKWSALPKRFCCRIVCILKISKNAPSFRDMVTSSGVDFSFRDSEHQRSLVSKNKTSALSEHATMGHSDIIMAMDDFDLNIVRKCNNPLAM